MLVRLRSAAALLICLMATRVSAAVYVDCSAPGPAHNGASWQTAFISISQALSYLGNGGEIWVKTGTYRERLTLNTYTTMYGGFLGFETSPSQRLLGAFETVISGGRRGRVIDTPVGARATLDGFTIRDGKADKGGGIKCSTDTTVTIRNCRIENCEATGVAGGILYDSYAQGSVANCFIERNEAPKGAGIVVGYHSYPTIQGSVIARNTATISGGGVYCPFHSGALLSNCTIAYNHADLNAGGVYAYYGGPVTLKSCIVAFNTAPDGGAFYADGGSSQATLSACDWYGNSAPAFGGAIVSFPAGAGNITSDPAFVMPDADEFHPRVGSQCSGMGAFALSATYAIDRIGVAKLLADGTSVKLSNKIISCVDRGTVYLQEPDRSSAIAVTGLAGCSPGQIVTSVIGTLAGRALSASSYSVCSSGTFSPRPLGCRISWLGTVEGIRAVTWGRVAALTSDGFELRDGQDAIRVRYAGPSPQVGEFVTVTGAYRAGEFVAVFVSR